MNKIKIVNDNLEKANISKSLQIEYFQKECFFSINDLKINVLKDCDLELEIDLKEDTKINFDINVSSNTKFNLYVISKGTSGKIQYKYNLLENSLCNVYKFSNIKKVKEMVIINLNGINANINYNFKTISLEKVTYDYHIFIEFQTITRFTLKMEI